MCLLMSFPFNFREHSWKLAGCLEALPSAGQDRGSGAFLSQALDFEAPHSATLWLIYRTCQAAYQEAYDRASRALAPVNASSPRLAAPKAGQDSLRNNRSVSKQYHLHSYFICRPFTSSVVDKLDTSLLGQPEEPLEQREETEKRVCPARDLGSPGPAAPPWQAVGVGSSHGTT